MYLNSKWWFGFLTVTTELGTFELVLRGWFRTLTRRREGRESRTEEKQEQEHDRGMNPHPSNKLGTSTIKRGLYEDLVWGPSSQAMVFPVVMYGCELNYKESWVPKNWCFWTVVLEKTLESPLDCKESQQVHLKRKQPWIFTEWTDAEAETPILWPPDAKNWLIWKDPDAGKDWRQEEKGTRENEMVGWHHQLNGHEFE